MSIDPPSTKLSHVSSEKSEPQRNQVPVFPQSAPNPGGRHTCSAATASGLADHRCLLLRWHRPAPAPRPLVLLPEVLHVAIRPPLVTPLLSGPPEFLLLFRSTLRRPLFKAAYNWRLITGQLDDLLTHDRVAPSYPLYGRPLSSHFAFVSLMFLIVLLSLTVIYNVDTLLLIPRYGRIINCRIQHWTPFVENQHCEPLSTALPVFIHWAWWKAASTLLLSLAEASGATMLGRATPRWHTLPRRHKHT